MNVRSDLIRPLCVCAAVAALAGCAAPFSSAQGGAAPGDAGLPGSQVLPQARVQSQTQLPSSPITHVVIIVQENRTVDNLFQFLPGANTASTGLDSKGQSIHLAPMGLVTSYDLSHKHSAFLTDYRNSAMNGFDLESSNCPHGHCGDRSKRAYGYVVQSQVQPYYTMAQSYAFADNFFQTNQGPSFPAHQYLISGTSTVRDGSSLRVAENPQAPHADDKHNGGCDSPSGVTVQLIDPRGNEKRSAYPCFNRLALMNLLDAQSVSWKYYQADAGAGLWNAVDAIKPIWQSDEYSSHVSYPSSQVLSDIAAGNLASVVWVTPTAAESDHALTNDGTGPAWVTSVVNAIGESPYWNSTAIFIVWDDWGGWYDHVKPPIYNSYELGFRVPLIVISPYAKQHYISHVQHEFGSILKFTEETFGLGSLGTTDVRADDLSDCFDYAQQPAPYQAIGADHDARYFLSRPPSSAIVDDDE